MEETKPLFRLLRTEAFRFIIVRYNHYSLVTQLKQDLLLHFPERPQNTIDARNADYRFLVDSYYKAKTGFFFIENFEEILANSEIYSGLNQRRDKLALYPIALIVFISSTTDELFARQIMEKMPDLWSFRSLMLDLKVDLLKEILQPILSQSLLSENSIQHNRSLGANSIEEKEKELTRLIARIKSISENEINLLMTVYEQIARVLIELGRFNEAIENYLKLEKILIKKEDTFSLGRIYSDIGLAYTYKKDFRKSLEYYHKSEEVLIKGGNEIALGTTYNNLGGVYSEEGDWDSALNYYNIAEELFLKSNHDEGLGATYNNISGFFIHKKDWKKALSFLKKSEENRLKCGDRRGLGATYFNLGFVYSKLKDLNIAIEYYLKSEELLLEFEDVLMLKVLYQSVAEIYKVIEARDKIIEYYSKLSDLEQKTGNKIGVGNALNYLGIVSSEMGDFNKSLAFHHQAEKIRYDIGDESGLIQTLYNIGMEWLKIKDGEKAINYFILAGYIAKKNNMNSELQKMNWALMEIIKKHGEKNFMKIGESHYNSWVQHAELEKKSSK